MHLAIDHKFLSLVVVKRVLKVLPFVVLGMEKKSYPCIRMYPEGYIPIVFIYLGG